MWGWAVLTIIVRLTPKLAKTEGKVELVIRLACFVLKEIIFTF
jgi:hypothetical protein